MENFEPKYEPEREIKQKPKFEQKRRVMPCSYSEKSIEELERDGWIEEWSFHSRISEQWGDACEKARMLKETGDWEAVLVKGQTEEEIKDGVTCLFKRKTQQRKKWDKERGY